MLSSIRSGVSTALLFAFFGVACTTKVSSNIIKGPIKERRARIEPARALGKSHWRWDGRGFIGSIEWESCRIDASWQETEQRISSTRTTPAFNYVLAAVGVGLIAAGAATYDYDGVERQCASFGCYDTEASNTFPLALALTGGLTLGGAASATAIRSKPTVEDVKTEQKRSSKNGPCITPADVAELKLVLQVADRKFVTVQVERDWSARIEIPPGVTLPRNVDLPVLVYKLPPKASHLAGRWHVIGHARAGADGVPSEAPG